MATVRWSLTALIGTGPGILHSHADLAAAVAAVLCLSGPRIIDQQPQPAQERYPSSLSAAAELEEQVVPPLGSIDR
jgi:hypothetical protein